MTLVEKYNKAKEDYNYLVEHHGQEPNDMTGGFVEGDFYKELLENPSKSTAYKHYVKLIEYSSHAGFESANGCVGGFGWDTEDIRCRGIYEYYGCI